MGVLPEIPEDFSSIADDTLTSLHSDLRAYAAELKTRHTAGETINPDEAIKVADAYSTATAELDTRTAKKAEADSKLNGLFSALDETDNEDEAEEQVEVPDAVEPEVVTATRSTLEPAAGVSAPKLAVMLTANDVPGFNSGMELDSFTTAAEAVTNRLGNYSTPSGPLNTGDSAPVALPGRDFAFVTPGRTATRHGGVIFRRQFPEELRVEDKGNPYRAIKFATDERRLPGGSLLNSVKQSVKNGKSLTAAVGWCAPSETIYDLCDLTSMDGLLDLPEIQAARGGFQVPADGGPDFSTVWNGIGDAGDVILTEYDVENNTNKVCFEIPCPDFEDVRLDAAYVCLTGSLLQTRGYPEVVEHFMSQSMVALAHKINQSVIAKIVAASGAATVIPADASGDDAVSALLSAVDLAVEDAKYRNRMARNTTLEVVLPYWVRVAMRAAASRRTGVFEVGVTDAMIMDWFAARNAVPRFVYDWQDAFAGLVGGPGGAAALTALPATGQFLIYPAGTWTKIVRDVVNLDTIYDSNRLTTNTYTALFAEDGFNVIQTCPLSRLYTVNLDPSGVTGCCVISG